MSTEQFAIRARPVAGAPKATQFRRGCGTCGADFLALAPGKTGERGIWRDWIWYCSAACDPAGAS